MLYYSTVYSYILLRFCINLRYISGIAFHFNPRFNDNVVVRNSLIKDRWGREERSGGLPFYRGQQFMVIKTCLQFYRGQRDPV